MKGPDEVKLKKIIQVLKDNPDGLWVREIARKANLDKTLVSRYLNDHLKDKIEVSFTLPIKLVRLK